MTTKIPALVLLCSLLATLAAQASPADQAIVAAMKIAEQPNYSWTSVITNDDTRASSTIQGAAERNGYMTIVNPTPSAYLRQRLGGGSTGPVAAVFKGERNCVILTTTGWLGPDELPPPTPTDAQVSQGTGRRGGVRGGGPGPAAPPLNSKLTFTVRSPQDEMEIIVGSTSEIRASGDTFAGELSEGGAMQFFNSFGQPEATVVKAVGSFKCWIQDGIVTHYELHISGSVVFGTDKKVVPVNWTLTTEVRDFGRTKVVVPAEAKARLGV